MNRKIRPRTAGPNNIIEDHRAGSKKMATTGQNFMRDIKAKTIAEDDEASERQPMEGQRQFQIFQSESRMDDYEQSNYDNANDYLSRQTRA